jgi:hypothetical protein
MCCWYEQNAYSPSTVQEVRVYPFIFHTRCDLLILRILYDVTKHNHYRTVLNLPLFVSVLFETLFAKCFGLCLASIKEILLSYMWLELCITHSVTLSCNISSYGEIYDYFSTCKHCSNYILINVYSFGKLCNCHGLVSLTRKSDSLYNYMDYPIHHSTALCFYDSVVRITCICNYVYLLI